MKAAPHPTTLAIVANIAQVIADHADGITPKDVTWTSGYLGGRITLLYGGCTVTLDVDVNPVSPDGAS